MLHLHAGHCESWARDLEKSAAGAGCCCGAGVAGESTPHLAPTLLLVMDAADSRAFDPRLALPHACTPQADRLQQKNPSPCLCPVAVVLSRAWRCAGASPRTRCLLPAGHLACRTGRKAQQSFGYRGPTISLLPALSNFSEAQAVSDAGSGPGRKGLQRQARTSPDSRPLLRQATAEHSPTLPKTHAKARGSNYTDTIDFRLARRYSCSGVYCLHRQLLDITPYYPSSCYGFVNLISHIKHPNKHIIEHRGVKNR